MHRAIGAFEKKYGDVKLPYMFHEVNVERFIATQKTNPLECIKYLNSEGGTTSISDADAASGIVDGGIVMLEQLRRMALTSTVFGDYYGTEGDMLERWMDSFDMQDLSHRTTFRQACARFHHLHPAAC